MLLVLALALVTHASGERQTTCTLLSTRLGFLLRFLDSWLPLQLVSMHPATCASRRAASKLPPATAAAAATTAAANLLPPLLPSPAAGACVGTAGKFAATGSSYMDGADDVAFLEVGVVGDAAEACCTMCAEREGCVAWDTYRESAGSYLCQVRAGREGPGCDVATE